ncbi:hypothetical protein TNCV_4514791 [Trichonephila clavipes]|nr:hypothetical protein TNCV_4514791 [Trichonephila clavipes]
MKTSSVNFNVPSPMESKYRRFSSGLDEKGKKEDVLLRTAYSQAGRCGMQPKAKHSLRAQAQLSETRTETVETFELLKVEEKKLLREEKRERESDILRSRKPVVNQFVEWPAKHASKLLVRSKYPQNNTLLISFFVLGTRSSHRMLNEYGEYDEWSTHRHWFLPRIGNGGVTGCVVVEQKPTVFSPIFERNATNSGHQTHQNKQY